tara:strand:- start:3151 stop:3327 length:177 start_codon:yes stop_codon:yes gene_type:complete
MEQQYMIVRFFREGGKGRQTIKTDLTLEEAQEWCSRDDTREEGVWFDGYTKQTASGEY